MAEDGDIPAGATLVWADVADAAVVMVHVAPMHETGRSGAGAIEPVEALGRKVRAVLGSTAVALSVALSVAPLSPCRTGLVASAAMRPASAVRGTRGQRRG